MLNTMRILLMGLAFFPLVFISNLFFPYVFSKAFVIKAVLSLSTIFFTIHFIQSLDFREKIIAKFNVLKNNKIVLSILAYFVIFTIGVILAKDKFLAFWGDVERAEGWVGILFFLLFFALTLLLFEKKHWLWFFRLSLITGLILFGHILIQYLNGVERPGSILDNPALLATYLLFVIFSSLLVFYESKRERNKFWLWFSGAMIFLSTIGIFITEVRGAILGLGIGILAVLIYFIFRGGQSKLFNLLNLKWLSVTLILLVFIFSGVFLATRKAEIWQKVPGLDRVAQISFEDQSTRSRINVAKISLNAINPVNAGITKFLFGYGWENFRLAWQKYYIAEKDFYDPAIYDRAHNKILDVLVMNGILGLLAYLVIWFFFFQTILKMNKFLPAIFLFFGVSFFAQNLVLFDHIASWLPFFAMLGFAIHLNHESNQ